MSPEVAPFERLIDALNGVELNTAVNLASGARTAWRIALNRPEVINLAAAISDPADAAHVVRAMMQWRSETVDARYTSPHDVAMLGALGALRLAGSAYLEVATRIAQALPNGWWASRGAHLAQTELNGGAARVASATVVLSGSGMSMRTTATTQQTLALLEGEPMGYADQIVRTSSPTHSTRLALTASTPNAVALTSRGGGRKVVPGINWPRAA